MTGLAYWIRRGFIPAEASAFKRITTEAITDSRYLKAMVTTRMRVKSEAGRQGMSIRQYYASIRAMYVRRGFADNAYDLLLRGDRERRNRARRLAFNFFNFYKDKYAIRDRSGKLIETPRKKGRARRKPITHRGTTDQLIRKHQDTIKYDQFRLRFERSPLLRATYQTSIANHRAAIKKLRAQR